MKDGGPGRVILLVGPSCAGKSTLARALQDAAPEPWVAQSLDGLFAAMPERWGGSGPFKADGFAYRWEPDRSRRIVYGPAGWRMLQGMRRAVAAYAAMGVDVVVDDMLLDEQGLADWAVALDGFEVLLVAVTAPLDELLRREAARERRRTPGLVAGHKALHDAIEADLVIDTAVVTPQDAAARILGRAFPAPFAGALARLV